MVFWGEQKQDKAPFREWKTPVLKAESKEFFELPEYPDFVVRRGIKITAPKRKEDIPDLKLEIEDLTKKARAFQNFLSRYGIRMAETSYFFGNDPRFVPSLTRKQEKASDVKEEDPSLMSITEKIEGRNLDDMDAFDDKMDEEIDFMYAGVFSGIFDSYNENGFWWSDYGNKQAVWGTRKHEKEPHLFIVDVDPAMKRWKDLSPDFQEKVFWNEVLWVFSQMKESEKKLRGKKREFEKARATLSKIIAEMPMSKDESSLETRERITSQL